MRFAVLLSEAIKGQSHSVEREKSGERTLPGGKQKVNK